MPGEWTLKTCLTRRNFVEKCTQESLCHGWSLPKASISKLLCKYLGVLLLAFMTSGIVFSLFTKALNFDWQMLLLSSNFWEYQSHFASVMLHLPCSSKKRFELKMLKQIKKTQNVESFTWSMGGRSSNQSTICISINIFTRYSSIVHRRSSTNEPCSLWRQTWIKIFYVGIYLIYDHCTLFVPQPLHIFT